MSLRTRIALAGGLVVFLAVLAAALVIYPAADRDLHDQLDASLVSTVASAPKFAPNLKQTMANDAGDEPFAYTYTVGGTLIQFIGGMMTEGMPTQSFVPVTDQDMLVAKNAEGAAFQTVKYRGQSYRMYSAPFLGGAAVVVRVAVPESVALASLTRLRWLLAALVAGGALTAAAAGRLLAGRVLRPVRALTETVERVTETQDLTAHLDPAGLEAVGGRARSRDEIGRLARSFTAMMAALDTSVRTQRHLVADASHELRTPLTSLTTNLELLAEPGGLADPQAPALLGAAREQSGELKALVNDLVDLARYGETETHLEDLRLDLLAGQVAARAARRAPGLSFETAFEECFVRADPDAVERALGNLVDNAVKWSPPGGAVRIAVTAGPEAACFSVADEGPGIPEADLPFVFDRFYRSAEARSMPGSGLGLSIVRQIAQTHGGLVSAHPLDRGLLMRLVMPLAA